MPLDPAELVKNDQDHLIHPLHHPSEHPSRWSTCAGEGATVTDIQGREYIDGLAGLWNVNVGHGREELAEAAADQMSELAYCSGYAGSSNIPAVELAAKLVELAPTEHAGGVLHLRRRRVQRVGLQDRALLLEGQGQAGQDQGHRPPQRLPRRDPPGDERHRHGAYWKMFEPRVPGFVHIPTCYPYRFRGRQARARPRARRRPALLEEAILREGPDTVAAFIAEPIHGGGGVIYPADDYFPLVRAGVRPARGAVHRRRGDHRLLPHRPVVRAGRTGTCSPTSCPSPRA